MKAKTQIRQKKFKCSTDHYCIKLKYKLSDKNLFKSDFLFLSSNVQIYPIQKKNKAAL